MSWRPEPGPPARRLLGLGPALRLLGLELELELELVQELVLVPELVPELGLDPEPEPDWEPEPEPWRQQPLEVQKPLEL